MGRPKLPEEERRRRFKEKHRKYNNSRDPEQVRKRKRDAYHQNAERERRRKREEYAARVAAKRQSLQLGQIYIPNQLGSGIVPKEEKKDHIPLEPAIEIKEEPTDYHPTPSTSNDPAANEEFILPHEDNSWTTPDAVVEPQFTLSVASLASPSAPDTTDSEQPKKKRKSNDSKTTPHVPSTNGPTTSSESPVYNFGEVSNPGSSKEHRKDHFDVFGEYIAAKLRNLDRVSCAFAQKAIGDIIFDAEMGKYLNQTQNAKS